MTLHARGDRAIEQLPPMLSRRGQLFFGHLRAGLDLRHLAGGVAPLRGDVPHDPLDSRELVRLGGHLDQPLLFLQVRRLHEHPPLRFAPDAKVLHVIDQRLDLQIGQELE